MNPIKPHLKYSYSSCQTINGNPSKPYEWENNSSHLPSPVHTKHPYQTPPKRNHGSLSGFSTFHWDHGMVVFNTRAIYFLQKKDSFPKKPMKIDGNFPKKNTISPIKPHGISQIVPMNVPYFFVQDSPFSILSPSHHHLIAHQVQGQLRAAMHLPQATLGLVLPVVLGWKNTSVVTFRKNGWEMAGRWLGNALANGKSEVA